MTEETVTRSWFKANVMKAFFAFATVSLVAFIGVRVRAEIVFETHVKSHLYVANHSVDPYMAEENLTYAINYMEANGLSHGYTSVFQNTEDENMDTWLQQLRDIREFIGKPDQKSTTILAMQGILSDHGKINTPDGAAITGNNKVMWWWGMLSFVAFLFSLTFGLSCGWDLNPAPPRLWY